MKHFLNILPQVQRFGPYAKFDARIFHRSRSLAKQLRPLSVIHINSAAAGGGVSELLKNQVPLERDLGLNSRWLVLRAPKQFFFVTKKIHNMLQGDKGFLSEPEENYFFNQLIKPGEELNKLIGREAGRTVVVLHDPQVLPLINFLPAHAGVISRLHMDLSTPDKSVLKFLKPFLDKAGKVVVSHKNFRPDWLGKQKTVISYPTINPFAPKNRKLSSRQTAALLKKFGIDTGRPIVAQVSRFDRWKDPQGVIEAYYLAKKQLPKLQLVLEGTQLAQDDPEAAAIFRELKMQHPNDPDFFLLGERGNPHDLWVNALQSRADVIVQKSLREGFGLTVTESLWKGKAVVGGNAIGIKVQIKNGQNGFIVSSPAECARRIVQLIKNPALTKRLGEQGHNFVSKNFLFNRLILDFLKMYKELA